MQKGAPSCPIKSQHGQPFKAEGGTNKRGYIPFAPNEVSVGHIKLLRSRQVQHVDFLVVGRLHFGFKENPGTSKLVNASAAVLLSPLKQGGGPRFAKGILAVNEETGSCLIPASWKETKAVSLADAKRDNSNVERRGYGFWGPGERTTGVESPSTLSEGM
ncbi:UNVERIFIED_CONTAM: hypothetical protein K2H54_047349 [Gekko kuhli]